MYFPKLRFSFLCILISLSKLYGDNPNEAWFLGPLIATSASNTPPGVVSVQPYIYFSDIYGIYEDSWKRISLNNIRGISPQLFVEAGLTDFVDFEIYPSFIHNRARGVKATEMQDMFFGFGFALSVENVNTWKPDVRLVVSELVPLGKYDNAKPKYIGCDLTGSGSWQTDFTLAIRKTVIPRVGHPLRLNLNLDYVYPLPVHIEGISVYGGTERTRGGIQPGHGIGGNFSIEFAATKQIGLMMEAIYQYFSPDKFVGDKGGAKHVGNGVRHLFSLAPEFEYAVSDSQGFVFGLVFSVAGKNIIANVSVVVSYGVSF